MLRELKALYTISDDADIRAQINILEKAFKNPLTTAIKRQINVLRRNGITGTNLLRSVTDIYHEYGMKDYEHLQNNHHEAEAENYPRIICSEALT